MGKKELKMRALVAPTETVIVSAYDSEGKAGACTLAFYMVSSHVPPCVTIAINAMQRRKTLRDILKTKAFVLGFPSAEQVREADYLGVESGYRTDKLKNIGFTTSGARCVNAPIIDQLALSLECEVVHAVTIGSHTQVTGEVKRIVADESILNGRDRVVLEKLQPLIYDEEEGVYHGIGTMIAPAFKTGAALMKSLEEQGQGQTG
jgi:flavin reductase (DIM6/NTAB) family NADH-FMN oxidoreductase RutF